MNSNKKTYRPSLSRKDIENYNSMSGTERNTVERKVLEDPFAADAMEGWENVGFNTSIMSGIDKKLNIGNNPIINISVYLLGAVAITFTILGTINQSESINVHPNQVADTGETAPNTIFIDKTEVITDTFIDQLPENNPNKTASAPVLQKNFKEEKSLPDLPDIEFIIEDLPVIELHPEPESKKEIKTRSQAKEMYLSDLKLIDYRAYRSKPTVQTEQLVLTGVPANKENEESTEMESTWKKVDVPYHDYIKKAMEQVADGKYKKALQRFEVVLKTYPDDINAHFYSAICYYNLGQYESALEDFKQCIHHTYNNFDEESLWLIANCYDEMGKLTEAQSIYKDIASKKGFYSEQARLKLKK